MKILSTVYDYLLRETPLLPPETGGILGGRNCFVTHYCFDKGQCALTSPAHYQPNTDVLNQIITIWQARNIQFCGLFHSHYPHDTELSSGDKSYITEIMLTMPSGIRTLYFPLILPRTTMIGYQANRYGSDIHIVCDKIEIFKKEDNL